MALSEGEKAIVLALDILTRQVTQQTFNLAEWRAEEAARTAPAAAEPAGAAPRQSLFNRAMGGMTAAIGALAGRFAALLGPLALFGTFLAAPTAGLSVFTGALRLFAASVAPVILPLVFTLSVGLASAGDVIFKKLLPALDGFTKFVLQTGIPAMAQFADAAGRATETIKILADSQVGRHIVESSGGGGPVGALNRTLDRMGHLIGVSADPDKGHGTVRSLSRAGDDALRMIPLIGDRAVSANNWLKRQVGVSPSDAPAGASAESTAATDKARLQALRELQLSMLPRGGVGGGPASIWSRAQQAALSQSPFEREMLMKVSEVIRIMTHAASPTGSGTTGTLTDTVDRMTRETLAIIRGRP